MMSLVIGSKYYKYKEDGSTDICRLNKIVDDSHLVISRGINRKKVPLDFLDSYTRLKEDGSIFISVVNMGSTIDHGQDVLVCLYRTKDLDEGVDTPYLACRQNIHDIFTNSVNTTNKTFLGMCMTQDNIPQGADFKDLLFCHGVDYMEKIAIYLEDTIYTILSMVQDTNRYNKVLYDIYKVLNPQGIYEGLNKYLYDLLTNTHFIEDFRNAYNVTKVNFNIKLINDLHLIKPQRVYFEDLLKIDIINTYVFPWDRSISLNEIERDYILVSDKSNKFYIVSYDKGDYKNRYYDERPEEREDFNIMIK